MGHRQPTYNETNLLDKQKPPATKAAAEPSPLMPRGTDVRRHLTGHMAPERAAIAARAICPASRVRSSSSRDSCRSPPSERQTRNTNGRWTQTRNCSKATEASCFGTRPSSLWRNPSRPSAPEVLSIAPLCTESHAARILSPGVQHGHVRSHHSYSPCSRGFEPAVSTVPRYERAATRLPGLRIPPDLKAPTDADINQFHHRYLFVWDFGSFGRRAWAMQRRSMSGNQPAMETAKAGSSRDG